jgi:hypothetical protein
VRPHPLGAAGLPRRGNDAFVPWPLRRWLERPRYLQSSNIFLQVSRV